MQSQTKPTALVVKEIDASVSALQIPIEVTVTSQQEYDSYAIVLKELTALEKIAQAKEDAIIKPIKQGIAALQAELKPGKDKIALAKKDVSSAMTAYRNAENLKAEQARQKILADQRLKPETVAVKIKAVEAPVFSNTTRVLKLFVTDESLIPREYFDLNQARLKQFLRDGGTVEGAYVDYETITRS